MGRCGGLSFENIKKTLRVKGKADVIVKVIWACQVPMLALLIWRVQWDRFPTPNKLERRGM